MPSRPTAVHNAMTTGNVIYMVAYQYIFFLFSWELLHLWSYEQKEYCTEYRESAIEYANILLFLTENIVS